MSAQQQPVIISCALTGAATTRKQCPALPYTPAEIGEEAKRAYEAGSTIVHIHAREDDGKPTWKLETFQRIEEEVRKRSPVLINFSTGGIEGTITDRTEQIEHATPHIAALNMGSMNYAIYSPTKKQFYHSFVFENPFHDIITALTRMQKFGVIPEMECFDAGHICNAEPLIDMGLLKEPLHYSLIMGVTGGISATPKNLKFMSEILPKGAEWQVIGISRDQWWLCDEALKLGGNIRVGLEDNFYRRDGETMAKSNGDLVEDAVKLVAEHGKRPATLEETRRIMGVTRA